MSSGSDFLSRRKFILRAAQASLGTGLVAAYEKSGAQSWSLPLRLQPFSILQGVTTATETQLTLDLPQTLNVQFVLVDTVAGGVLTPIETRVRYLPFQPWAVHFVKFSGLVPTRKYLFQVLSESREMLDERELQSLDLQKPDPKVTFVSCSRDNVENEKIWTCLVQSRPDLLVFMGDNVYGDLHGKWGPEVLVKRYLEARSRIYFYRQRVLIPVVALWDDHDFGKNNDCGEYIYKESSLETFKTFFARDEVPGVYQTGPGVASYFRAFSMQFLMLDDRYFRSPNRASRGHMLGDEQMNWALSKLAEFSGPTWIIHGNQFFGDTSPGESYEGNFYRDFTHFLDGIRGTRRRVLFAGGDIHHSETMTIPSDYLGYETYELTSSGIHSDTLSVMPGNRRRRQATTKHNFVEVQHGMLDDRLALKMRSISKENTVLFRDEMELRF